MSTRMSQPEKSGDMERECAGQCRSLMPFSCLFLQEFLLQREIYKSRLSLWRWNCNHSLMNMWMLGEKIPSYLWFASTNPFHMLQQQRGGPTHEHKTALTLSQPPLTRNTPTSEGLSHLDHRHARQKVDDGKNLALHYEAENTTYISIHLQCDTNIHPAYPVIFFLVTWTPFLLKKVSYLSACFRKSAATNLMPIKLKTLKTLRSH